MAPVIVVTVHITTKVIYDIYDGGIYYADFQQVYDYQSMIKIVYLPPEETDGEAEYLSVHTVMQRIAQSFPNFIIGKNTDKEVGRKLAQMGYERKHKMNGTVYRMEER